MSDAEATVKFAIFDGICKANPQSPNDWERLRDTIFKSIAANDVRWALTAFRGTGA